MKIFLEISSMDNMKRATSLVEYVVGLEGVSLRAPVNFTLDELDLLIERAKIFGQEVAVNANKIFHEDDLDELKRVLKAIKKRNVKHLFFSDLAVYMMAKELQMEDRLIYDATTYLTNSGDINDYLDLIDQVVVSPDLALKEQIEIVNNAKKTCVLYAFGKYAIFHSARELLTNYFKYRQIDNINPIDNRQLTIVEELRYEHHPIIEDENGTHVFLSHFYCLLKEIGLFSQPFDLYLSTNFLTTEQINFLVNIYDKLLQNLDNGDHLYEELQAVIPGLGEGIRNQKSYLLKGGSLS